ncbi:hypothetical protein SteCoe_3828 [Stentor coeruleus]|uniref:Uncharacterized protein n=1 Tax=Stentor coeruleus TaxID=5963 RepID=A0A1R2CW60_9CILI|nr:hypothetical protein SteCoe_3828 [Stentor coeruleus]
MTCVMPNNLCVANTCLAIISGLTWVVSSYQVFRIFAKTNRTAKLIKFIVSTSNLLMISMMLHYIFTEPKFALLFVFMEFLLYLTFCLIAMFYVSQATTYLQDSSMIIKASRILLGVFFIILLILFGYFSITVGKKDKNYDKCDTVIWAVTKYTSFCMALSFLCVGLKLCYKIKQQKNLGQVINMKRVTELWYFLYRVLILLIFFSVFISFMNYVLPTFILQTNCDILMVKQTDNNIAILSIERIFTHFLPIWFSVFVFWHGRQRRTETEIDDVRDIQEIIKNLSMMDMDCIEDDQSYR